ncbi:DUF6431 domain-containing protein [Desulfotruncus alcoholivorax]|uniref:DUF6431 domain-containing protein n=1 Tax=Desulfotruncus alcoholivorax TaxID=265477 RepID=UPI001C706895|nr:DUF6431 domain-containing protein [Desulfotruncus alcoholivorax]
MQQIFYTTATPEEYQRIGKNFPFPVPDSCPNPECLIKVPPQKHSFYERNIIDTNFCGRILIRRYYCKHCGKTISYLPSFCLPYFQYTVEIIIDGVFTPDKLSPATFYLLSQKRLVYTLLNSFYQILSAEAFFMAK